MATGTARRPDARRVALVVLAWAALAALLVAAGDLVVHSGAVQGFDRHVTARIVLHRSEPLDAAMKAVTWLGSWVALVVVGVAVVILVVGRRLPIAFLVLAVVAWAGTQGATTLAKHMVQRPRPPERIRLVSAHGWSWPSGHTATAVLVFGVIAAAVWSCSPSARLRASAVAGGVLAVAAVAFSRVELGVHWTTDVLAGIVMVVAWLCALWLLAGRVFVPGMRGDGNGTPTSAGAAPNDYVRPSAPAPAGHEGVDR